MVRSIWHEKRGVSVWISYVMLTAMVVSLGILVLRFSRDNTEQTVEDLVERGDALTECEQTGIHIREACQDAQTLNMNVTNVNNRRVDELLVRTFDIYRNPGSGGLNVTILPQETKEVSVIKQGISTRAEVIPVVRKSGSRIICQSRSVALEEISIC
jgi:hypothetical protein